ncbi:MAG: tRNA (adenosine(37)-N6)-dimethylallyltransferase MiaA [Desulfobacteraceae bacterium]|nr:MAG: tRNA (adenosine(37)-N6)-dimethylallyltransferase MiaA [Desulfobacteraceae bacterium]
MDEKTRPLEKIVVICGPTGIGKTAVAVEAAERFGGRIIGADSVQIYRHMDIGTAKPNADERSRIPHYMIDIVEPDQPFDAAEYAETASAIAGKLIEERVAPFVVGGTGLYIKTLIHGIFRQPASNPSVRRELRQAAERFGTRHLFEELLEADPQAASKIHPNDAYRIIRALEVYRVTGKGISELHRNHGFADRLFMPLKIGLHTERKRLYERIDRRVDSMIEEGLIGEVRALLEQGYGEELKSMQSLGYRHMTDYLRNRTPLEEAVIALKRDTRRYAKRQMTWFRADPEVCWFEPEQIVEIIERIGRFLDFGFV